MMTSGLQTESQTKSSKRQFISHGNGKVRLPYYFDEQLEVINEICRGCADTQQQNFLRADQCSIVSVF
jgi:hypothetical protein